MENQPTIYARLMEFANDQPRRELYEFIEKRTKALTGDLATELVEQLRKAYQAGVVDGFQQGVQADEAASLRMGKCLAPLLCIVRADHGDGSDTEGLPELLAAASRAMSRAIPAETASLRDITSSPNTTIRLSPDASARVKERRYRDESQPRSEEAE